MSRTLIDPVRRFLLPDRGMVRGGPYSVIAAVGLVAGVALGTLTLVQRLEWALYDRMMVAATRDPVPPSDIVIVAIDEPSFSELRMQWPWPRRVHAALVDALVRDGARTIVLDLVFDEPSTDDDDDALTEAIRRAGNVVLASDRAVTTDRGYQLEQWVDPLPKLGAAAAGIGAVAVDRDPDGVIRRVATSIDGRPMLALAAAARQPGFVHRGTGDRLQLLNFLGATRRGIVTVSYYQALEPGLLPSGYFKNKIVLVGRSLSAAAAVDQPDHFRTPVAVLMSGVEVHASQIDALLRHRDVADPFGAFAANALLALTCGALAALLFFRLAPHNGLLALLAVAAGGIVVAYASLTHAAVRVPVVGPLLAMTTVFASTSAYRFALGQRERHMIKRAFQHYVAPAIVQQMLDDPARLTLGGEPHDVSIIFTDLEGFTSVAERLRPEELRARLSEYFKAMMDVLLVDHATLDKFIGDAIMVYFGCPVPDSTHPQQACRAALAMQRRLDELNDGWRRSGAPVLHMRIGVNTGVAVAGNMGTDEIFNYTIIGDCVNLASRLEGVNKAYGTKTILGADTWARVAEQFEARELDWIRVKGKAQPVAIYELLAAANQLSPEMRVTRDQFAAGLALYRDRKWRDAEAAFRRALEKTPDDGPSRVFVERCAHYAAAPPPGDWDGVYQMLTK